MIEINFIQWEMTMLLKIHEEKKNNVKLVNKCVSESESFWKQSIQIKTKYALTQFVFYPRGTKFTSELTSRFYGDSIASFAMTHENNNNREELENRKRRNLTSSDTGLVVAHEFLTSCTTQLSSFLPDLNHSTKTLFSNRLVTTYLQLTYSLFTKHSEKYLVNLTGILV